MNGAHLHLMSVHFPIAGEILCALLLLAAWWLKNDTVKLVGLALVVFVGLSVWAADKTGGLASRILRDYPEVNRDTIHIHAEAADWAVRSLTLNGLLAAYGLFTYWKKRKLPKWLFIVVTILAIHGSLVVARVGYLGGQIRHPETRMGSDAATPMATPQATPPGK